MKRIYLFFSSLLILFFISCDDELQEFPKDSIAEEDFFQNGEEVQDAITGVYHSFYNNYGINYWLFLVNHADYENGRGSQAPFSDFSKPLDDANVQRAADIWLSFYITINGTNTVIDKLTDGVENLDEEEKNVFLGEAYFLRALSYFNLVRGFGPVPLKLEHTESFEDVEAPRPDSVDDVYKMIIEDVKIAIENLPESVGNNTGQASKFAAKMLLADIYLTIEEWEGAAEQADDVINDGDYALISAESSDDFYNIFAVETSSEDIFSRHNNSEFQSVVPQYLHRPNTPPYNPSSAGTYAWLPNMDSWLADWEEDDLRRNFNLYSEFEGPDGKMESLPSSTPILFGKFIYDDAGLKTYSDPIYRLTEAYLIFAEADSEAAGAPTQKAIDRLNRIKRRAYGYDMETGSPVDYDTDMGMEEFRDIIMDERAKEFIVEGKRWFDLLRTGRAKEAQEEAQGGFDESRLLWPIPDEEIQNNPAMNQNDQNPGY